MEKADTRKGITEGDLSNNSWKDRCKQSRYAGTFCTSQEDLWILYWIYFEPLIPAKKSTRLYNVVLKRLISRFSFTSWQIT